MFRWVPPEHTFSVNARDAQLGRTALHCAAWHGSAEVCAELIERGADTGGVDAKLGRTPLHYAAWQGHHECIKVLLKVR